MAPPPALSSLSGLSAAGVAQMDISFPHSRPRSFVRPFVSTRLADPPSFLPSLSPNFLALVRGTGNDICLLIQQAGKDLSHPFGCTCTLTFRSCMPRTWH